MAPESTPVAPATAGAPLTVAETESALANAATTAATQHAADIAATTALVDTLFVKHCHGTRLGNDTELYNLVFAFKEELKAALVQPTQAS